jgi:hypothetical protein
LSTVVAGWYRCFGLSQKNEAARRNAARRSKIGESMGRAALARLFLVTLMMAPATARSQVNVEPFRFQLKDRGFGARLAASAASYAGNTHGVALSGAAFGGFRSSAHLGYLATSGSYTALGGTVSIANWFAHLRHDYELQERVSWEEFAQLESDRFRRITWRELLGTGPRFRIVDVEWLQLFLGAAYMYEYTTLSGAADRGKGGVHRSSNYAALTLRADPKISFSSVTYFQPRLDQPSDFLVLSNHDADFEITGRLHSKLSAKFRYDPLPPPGVEPADLELSSGLELRF